MKNKKNWLILIVGIICGLLIREFVRFIFHI